MQVDESRWWHTPLPPLQASQAHRQLWCGILNHTSTELVRLSQAQPYNIPRLYWLGATGSLSLYLPASLYCSYAKDSPIAWHSVLLSVPSTALPSHQQACSAHHRHPSSSAPKVQEHTDAHPAPIILPVSIASDSKALSPLLLPGSVIPTQQRSVLYTAESFNKLPLDKKKWNNVPHKRHFYYYKFSLNHFISLNQHKFSL